MKANSMFSKMCYAMHARLADDGTVEDLARAALMAIREPDDGMIDAGEAHDEGGWGSAACAETHWTAMIDHILQSNTEEGK